MKPDAARYGHEDLGGEVVIVHDWIGGTAGAEQVLKELADLFPEAPVLTLFANTRVLPGLGIEAERVHQSYLGRIPGASRYRKYLVPLFADAVQTLDVGNASLVIASSHAVAKGIPHRSYQRLIAYLHTPMRYAYDLMPQYVRGVPRPARPWVRGALRRLAAWDVTTAHTVTTFVANSRAVADRIWTTYRRRAAVVHPPVDVMTIPAPADRQPTDYYVALGRLVSYKRFDIAVRAAIQLGRRLLVIGTGPTEASLKRLTKRVGGTRLVDFTGHVSEQEKYALLVGAGALLFPGEEDFGIVGVEALATGTPVIALGRGGMLDILNAPGGPLLKDGAVAVPGGVLFAPSSVEGMVAGIRLFEALPQRGPSTYRTLSLQFSRERFRSRFMRLVESTLNKSVGSWYTPL